MNDLEKQAALATKLEKRIREDEKWAKLDFAWAQTFTWLAILASFFSAILVAAEAIPKLLLALLAAIPGTVIVIEKSFSFAKRARWHWEMVAGLDELLNALMFQGVPVEVIAERLSEFRREMERTFPGMTTEGLTDPIEPR